MKKTFYLILKENPVFFTSKPDIDCICICTSMENAQRIFNDKIVNNKNCPGNFMDDGSYSSFFHRYYIVEREVVFDEITFQGKIE